MAEPRRGFREIEHTADLGIEAAGANPAELFAAAAEGFYSLVVDPAGVEPKQEIHVEASGSGWEELLQAWLSELLAEFNLRGFVGKNCAVTRIEAERVHGTVKGETLDLTRHRFHTEIKAVTYHELKVWRDGGAWRARVIFDV
ncbi:MAG TPA: archease [Candidatus Binatia bacterium]|nr:archease [Candidatus Binatia bacterium]